MSTDLSQQETDQTAVVHRDTGAEAPVFVGGTGRSGTTLTGRIIGSSDQFFTIPIELRFHVDPSGFPDLIDGSVSVEEFVDTMRNRWFRRFTPSGLPRGLHLVVDDDVFEAAMARFEAAAPGDRVLAARGLMSDIAHELMAKTSARRWVEMTPPNVEHVSDLLRVYPDARFVHVYRDGRDVACSVAPLDWGPKEPLAAVRWWERQMRRAMQDMEGMEDQVFLVPMAAFLRPERRDTISRLFDHLGGQASASLFTYLDEHVSVDRAHVGRWRRDLSEGEQEDMDREYRAARERLLTDYPMLGLP